MVLHEAYLQGLELNEARIIKKYPPFCLLYMSSTGTLEYRGDSR